MADTRNPVMPQLIKDTTNAYFRIHQQLECTTGSMSRSKESSDGEDRSRALLGVSKVEEFEQELYGQPMRKRDVIKLDGNDNEGLMSDDMSAFQKSFVDEAQKKKKKKKKEVEAKKGKKVRKDYSYKINDDKKEHLKMLQRAKEDIEGETVSQPRHPKQKDG
eukprot:12426897-Ditylum_brightwellii.AAC.1